MMPSMEQLYKEILLVRESVSISKSGAVEHVFNRHMLERTSFAQLRGRLLRQLEVSMN